MNNSDSLSIKDRLDYAMKHFSMIADQRMKTFHFYLIATAAAVSASVAVAVKSNLPRETLCLIGMAHVFIAGIFALIDWRGCRILGIAGDALADLERTNLVGLSEQQINEDRRTNKTGLWKLVSYRTAFGIALIGHAAFGVLFAWKPSWFLG